MDAGVPAAARRQFPSPRLTPGANETAAALRLGYSDPFKGSMFRPGT